jgi:hypothetical protein
MAETRLSRHDDNELQLQHTLDSKTARLGFWLIGNESRMTVRDRAERYAARLLSYSGRPFKQLDEACCNFFLNSDSGPRHSAPRPIDSHWMPHPPLTGFESFLL